MNEVIVWLQCHCNRLNGVTQQVDRQLLEKSDIQGPGAECGPKDLGHKFFFHFFSQKIPSSFLVLFRQNGTYFLISRHID